MTENIPRYRAILTDAGAALESRGLTEGKGIIIDSIAVGDANNKEITPQTEAVSLAHQVWQGEIEYRQVSSEDPNITNISAMIPADVGGFWVREVGVFAHLEGEDEEVLYVYANHAPYYKILPADGQATTHLITIPIIQSGIAQIEIRVSNLGYVPRPEFAEIDTQRKLWLSRLTKTLLNMEHDLLKESLKRIALHYQEI